MTESCWQTSPVIPHIFSVGEIILTVPVSQGCTYSSFRLYLLKTSPLPFVLCLSDQISCLFSNVLYHPLCLCLYSLSLQLKSCLSSRAELRCPLLCVVQQLLSSLIEHPRAFARPVTFTVVCFACSCLFTQLLSMVQSPGVQRWTRWSLLSQGKVDAFSVTVASMFGEVYFFLIFIYLLTALGLHCSVQALCCCAWTLSSCCERELLSSCGLWVSH